ncbi:hypothetical protein D3C80_492100 [compost metagenome]
MKERNPPRVPAARPVRSLAPKARDIPSLICARPKSNNATAPNRLMLTTTDSIGSPRLSFPSPVLHRPATQLRPLQNLQITPLHALAVARGEA